MKISRNNSIVEEILFVDGLPGTGKTLFSWILPTFDRIEKLDWSEIIETYCELWYLDKISLNTASSMIKMFADLKIYNEMMGRQVNFRPSDQSSVFWAPDPKIYFDRIFSEGDAEALNKIGLDRAVVIYGAGGLDEASLEGANHVRFIENGNISSTIVEPSHLGLSNCANAELKGGDLKTNIEILSNLLKGSGTKAQQEVVALNNSFVLWASGLETDLTLGVNKSLNSLKSGEGWLVLERLRTFLDDKSCD